MNLCTTLLKTSGFLGVRFGQAITISLTFNNNILVHLPKLYIYIYRVSQEERTKLREGIPYVKLYRYNLKHLYPKLNGYGDNGKRSLKL